jgi:hypothetical protein
MAKPKSGFWKANQGFATDLDGEPLFVQKGELVRDGHPLLKGREQLFDPADRLSRFDDRPDVEQATKAPGEKRGKPRGRPRKKVADVPAAEPKPSGLTTKDIQPGSTRSAADD